MGNILENFVTTFADNEETKLTSPEAISVFEQELNIQLPAVYNELITQFGFLSTPKILDIIDRKNIEDFTDIQEFWSLEQILQDKKEGETADLEEDFIPFASDCLDNIYLFKTDDLKTSQEDVPVYIFDIEFGFLEEAGDSFSTFLEKYIEM